MMMMIRATIVIVVTVASTTSRRVSVAGWWWWTTVCVTGIVTMMMTIVIVVALSCGILHRQDGLVQLTPVGRLPGRRGFRDRGELHKGVIPFQINTQEFPVGFKQQFQIFLFGGMFVKIDHEQGVTGGDIFASFVFNALDASIAAGKFGADRP